MSEFIIIIRPSFMTFCGDACRAAALNHILYRLAYKCKDEPKERIQAGEITWYATTDQIVEEMSDAWGVCKVRKEVNALIDQGLVGRARNMLWGADRTKHFFFGEKQCQKFLQLCKKYHICVVHLGLSPEVTHLIYVANANHTSIECICEKHHLQMIDSSNANDKNSEAIPKGTSKDDSKGTNKGVRGSIPMRPKKPNLISSSSSQEDTHTPPAPNLSSLSAELTPEGKRVVALYAELRMPPILMPSIVAAANLLGNTGQVTRETLELVLESLDLDPWFSKHNVVPNLEWAARRWDTCLDQGVKRREKKRTGGQVAGESTPQTFSAEAIAGEFHQYWGINEKRLTQQQQTGEKVMTYAQA